MRLNKTTIIMGCFALSGCGDEDRAEPTNRGDLLVLSYNVGNPIEQPPEYRRRIRSLEFEEYLAAQIQDLRADVITLQEVLSLAECAEFVEDDPARTCFGVDEGNPPVRRLLGPDYSIACDQRLQTKCIGVHVDFGRIEGVPPGGLALQGADTPPLPGPACETKEECNAMESACLDQTSVSKVVIQPPGLPPMETVNVHTSAFGDGVCRAEQVEQAFSLGDRDRVVLAGDWNFDPLEETDDPASPIWERFVGANEPFRNHHPVEEETDVADLMVSEEGLVPTREDSALDLVVTNFATGTCAVLDDPPLDAGFEFPNDEVEARRPDHFAVSCELSVP